MEFQGVCQYMGMNAQGMRIRLDASLGREFSPF